MGRALRAVIATQALLAVAAPAIAGAAQRPGKALPARVTTLLTSNEGRVSSRVKRASSEVIGSEQGSKNPSKDRATNVFRSTAVALNRLSQQTGKR
jgi:hypothetical protein